MTDVFFCSINQPNSTRFYIEKACLVRWEQESHANVFSMNPWMPEIDCFVYEFQRERRILADRMAISNIYIVTDDDCMPLGTDFIARGLAVMEAHPEFGILAAMNYINAKDTEPYTGKFIDDDVWECHAVGGIRFCRKGIIKDWPASVSPGSYDCQHHEGLVAAGYKAGYMRRVQMNHLGYGLSTHWPPGKTEIEQLEEARA